MNVLNQRRTAGRSTLAAALVVVLAQLLALPAARAEAAAAAEDQVGWITLEGRLMEQPNPFAWLVGERGDATLRGMMSKFDEAAERDDMKGLVIHVKDLTANAAQIHSLREGMKRVQDAGKPVYVFSEVYGPGHLMLASGADRLLVQDGGYVSFPGLYSEEMYLADTLKLVGLEPDFVQVGDYKGAADPIARSSPSPEWNENIENLLDGMWAQMTDAVKEGRGYSERRWRKVLDQAWTVEAEDAISLGLVDAQLDAAELTDYVKEAFDDATITTDREGRESKIDRNNPFAIFNVLMSKPQHTPKRETIAVVHINGPIVDGESQPGGLFGGESVGSRTIRKALKTIEEENRIKGLVIRINSPGGSALASEIIWQGVRRVAEHKPVHVSVGDMAASGGYYIAVSGDEIYVDPMSIVGSIGVVGGKIVMGGLYDKINLGLTPRSRGPHAEMFSTLKTWDPEERAKVRNMMKKTYDLFAERVVQGRGEAVEMSEIAEGRLFTGAQAVENGMADGLLVFDEVIANLASEAGLEDGQYDVMTYPGPSSFEEMVERMFPFAAGVRAPRAEAAAAAADRLVDQAGASLLRRVIGEKNWPQVRDALNALALLRHEHVLLVSPRILVIR